MVKNYNTIVSFCNDGYLLHFIINLFFSHTQEEKNLTHKKAICFTGIISLEYLVTRFKEVLFTIFIIKKAFFQFAVHFGRSAFLETFYYTYK
jgi:hypothetical protein